MPCWSYHSKLPLCVFISLLRIFKTLRFTIGRRLLKVNSEAQRLIIKVHKFSKYLTNKAEENWNCFGVQDYEKNLGNFKMLTKRLEGRLIIADEATGGKAIRCIIVDKFTVSVQQFNLAIISAVVTLSCRFCTQDSFHMEDAGAWMN